jgi:serine/threonine-protein kinase
MSSPPATLGQYQIIREIARSNDIVYEAYDALMNRRVAVKELAVPPGSTAPQREERIQRFRREAQAAGTLNHPSIMTVYSFGEESGRIFMAMEFLDGRTLRNEIESAGFLPPERAVEIAIAVLEGLQHAHQKGVIHRDIKPENIQLTSSGQVKITDFGIARLTFQPNLTLDGQVFGTPSYMSPEQIVGRDIDARSDLFSLAVVLYEMIAGIKPFAGDNVVSISHAIMNAEPTVPAQMPRGVWSVVRRALEKAPASRYATAGEMVQALKDAVAGNAPYADPTALAMPSAGAVINGPPPVLAATPGYAPAPPGMYAPGAGQATSAPYVPGGYSAPVGYVPPNGMPAPGPLPQYYPPPPRVPLIKPETGDFLKRALLTFLIVGTLLGLIVVACMALADAIARYGMAEREGEAVRAAKNLDPNAPLDDRIQEVQRRLNMVQSQDSRAEIQRVLAELQDAKGRSLVQKGDAAGAEFYLSDSVRNDPTRVDTAVRLGDLYWRKAQEQPDRRQRLDLYREAGEAYARAAQWVTDPMRRQEYRTASAQLLVSYAQEALEENPASFRLEIRQALYDARERAPANSPLEQQIQALLSSVR